MPVWTPEQLNRWTLQAEETFIREYNCIIDRVALPIVSGTDLYTLDDNVCNIRRVTYRGKKLDPLTHRDQREYLDGPIPSGTPTAYIFQNVGDMTIRLFPNPSETLSVNQIDLHNPENIRIQCIVEFYTMPVVGKYALPDFFRRRLLKSYVLKRAFLSEQKGQDIKASRYWEKKWDVMLHLYGDQIYDLLNTPRRLIQSELNGRFPASPTLPLDRFGIGVRAGE